VVATYYQEPEAGPLLQDLWLGYTESTGAPALRHEIAHLYTTIQPEQVLVHTGAEEAIFLFMHAALQPGDHVIVHSTTSHWTKSHAASAAT
jgi:aspartate/methionine/tyrosine aminotransferase